MRKCRSVLRACRKFDALIHDLDVVAVKSKEFNVAAENLIKPDSMRAICFEPPAEVSLETVVAGLLELEVRHWQIEILASDFVTALKAEPKVATDESNEATES
jgi:ribonuclease D